MCMSKILSIVIPVFNFLHQNDDHVLPNLSLGEDSDRIIRDRANQNNIREIRENAIFLRDPASHIRATNRRTNLRNSDISSISSFRGNNPEARELVRQGLNGIRNIENHNRDARENFRQSHINRNNDLLMFRNQLDKNSNSLRRLQNPNL